MLKMFIFSVIFVGFAQGHRHRSPPPLPCGIPQFVDELAEQYQVQLKDIWKNYTLGSKCYIEQAKTVEVLDELPKELRTSLQARPPLPEFLVGLPKDVVSQFDNIFFNKTIPIANRIEQLHELGEKILPAKNLEIFHKHQQKKADEKKHYDDLLAKLSPTAKEVDDKVRDLNKQRSALIDQLDEKTKKELFDLWDARPHIPQ